MNQSFIRQSLMSKKNKPNKKQSKRESKFCPFCIGRRRGTCSNNSLDVSLQAELSESYLSLTDSVESVVEEHPSPETAILTSRMLCCPRADEKTIKVTDSSLFVCPRPEGVELVCGNLLWKGEAVDLLGKKMKTTTS